MEPQPPSQSRNSPFPQPYSILPPHPSQIPSRTANSTPVSSPGLFSPSNPRTAMSLPASQNGSEGTTPAAQNSPFLHPLQNHKVRETHIANVDRDFATGRKIINQYEVIEEIGRGVHGKVKLARNLENGENVAIKIIPRFSKKRRLGKITQNMSPQEKTKKEIAILKKIRHPNVVALLEVIDDPELKKIYMVLEHVECGEIVWRKKGLPHVCNMERLRAEREMSGEQLTEEEESYMVVLQQRYNLKELKRARAAEKGQKQGDYWSLEYGADDTDTKSRRSERDFLEPGSGSSSLSAPASAHGSRPPSRAPSRTQSVQSMSADLDLASIPNEDDLETPGPLRSNHNSSTALDGTMYGAYDDVGFRERSPSMADSIISHMSSIDFPAQAHDPYADDYSYVPCFTLDQARSTFRDTVLGLEYLHFEGVVHRDIKPANLLWTRDHRVKISDFGVSYFGRPIRDGELDDTVSESEARDFDDDLELAKTVGTPAFFAPELCYTDIDSARPPPKVSEQIDVWSLGVTLYCLIFARIPFMAEDEFSMFRKIATQDIYIPSKRLRPVDPSTSPKTTSLYSRVNSAPYRDDDELSYEDVDPALRDLLQKMLEKDPRKRIVLREVKRHPWVLEGLPNFMGWMDDTDPYRKSAGRKIQVNDEELHEAVVPLTLLERARSTLKKTLGKFTHGSRDRDRERAESASRRRATSSAASSVGGDSPVYAPPTPSHPRDLRRKSLRGGELDYFAQLRDHSHTPSEHPLTHSVTASPGESPTHEEPTATTSRRPTLVGGHPYKTLHVDTDFNGREDAIDRQTPTASHPKFSRHGHSQSITNAVLTASQLPLECRTVPKTPAVDSAPDDPSSLLRKGRDRGTSDDVARSQSVDRAIVFSSNDKRAGARVGLSTLNAPGNVELPKRLQQMRSLDLGQSVSESPLPSPHFFSPHAISAYQHGQHKSDPNMLDDKFRTVVQLDERPMTAHRIQDFPEGTTPPPRKCTSSTPDSFVRAQETLRRRASRARLEYEQELRRRGLRTAAAVDPALIPCPPSPDDNAAFFDNTRAPTREHTFSTIVSSNSASADTLATPLTSPSVVTSPVCSANPLVVDRDSEQITAFQSDPSLPALLSGASSVSADPEGEFLGAPGNPDALSRTALLETTDSVTPPALAKESIAGFPLEGHDYQDPNNVPVRINHPTQEEDEDSDGDGGGLMMGRRKKKAISRDNHLPMGKLVIGSKRRDTNASVGSTDTAKKVFFIPSD